MNKYITSIAVILGSVCLINLAYGATAIYQLNETQGTFLQVPLTHEIYRYSQQTNLQDVEVLDADKNALPYRLVTIAPEVKQIDPKILVDELRFFPIAADATPDTLRKFHSTHIKVQGDSVQVTTSDKTLANANPEFYLIDVSKLDHDATSLGIDWVPQTDNQYLEVELEATRNLQDWFFLAKSTLVQIEQEEHHLKRNHIEVAIAKKDFEFLRLRILRGANNLQITHVTAEQRIGAAEKPHIEKESWSLMGDLAKNQNTVYLPNSHSKSYPVAAWEFIRNDTAPIDSIAIDFGTQTYGDSARIFSRTTENQNWQLQQQGIWFNAQIGKEWQKSNPVNIVPPNRDKYWRIELNETLRDKLIPSLIVGWQPTQLQIITNNKPPYVLAINQDKTTSYNREQVFNQILATANPAWVSTGLIPLNVQPEALINAPKAIDWKQWLFWVALMLAVSVLLVFSLKLFKQFNRNSTH